MRTAAKEEVRSAYLKVLHHRDKETECERETFVTAVRGPDGCEIYSIYQINMGWNNSPVFLHSWICLTNSVSL